MLAQLKTYALAILAVIATIAYALFKTEQTKRYKNKMEVAKVASDTLVRANKGINEVEKEGRQKLDQKDPNRSHFE